MKVIFKTNLFIWFHIFKLNDLKVIHDLYSQCLTQILSETTSNSEPEGVHACAASHALLLHLTLVTGAPTKVFFDEHLQRKWWRLPGNPNNPSSLPHVCHGVFTCPFGLTQLHKEVGIIFLIAGWSERTCINKQLFWKSFC
jgi:hypothetical protein